jgi:hypothetical protein
MEERKQISNIPATKRTLTALTKVPPSLVDIVIEMTGGDDGTRDREVVAAHILDFALRSLELAEKAAADGDVVDGGDR